MNNILSRVSKLNNTTVCLYPNFFVGDLVGKKLQKKNDDMCSRIAKCNEFMPNILGGNYGCTNFEFVGLELDESHE